MTKKQRHLVTVKKARKYTKVIKKLKRDRNKTLRERGPDGKRTSIAQDMWETHLDTRKRKHKRNKQKARVHYFKIKDKWVKQVDNVAHIMKRAPNGHGKKPLRKKSCRGTLIKHRGKKAA